MESKIIKINAEECIGCGMCANVCPRHLFTVDKIAECSAQENNCFKCYQCFAACPKKAISVECDDDVVEYSKEAMDVDPGNLLNVMKFRRSVRKFQDKKISDEDMEMILKAGKAAPTGKNRPLFRFILVDEKMEETKLCLMEELSKFAAANDATNPVIGSDIVRNNMMTIFSAYKETGVDRLSFNAPNWIILVCDKKCGGRPMLDAGIAGAYMELMANTLGIGVCFLGFAMAAIENSQVARDALGLKDNEMVGAFLTLGYPKYKYLRTAPRKNTPLTKL